MLSPLHGTARRAWLWGIAPCLVGLSLIASVAGCDTGRRVLPPLPEPTAEPIEEPSASPRSELLPAAAAGVVPLSLDDVNRIAGRGQFKSATPPQSGASDIDGEAKPPECQPVLHTLQNKAVSGTAYNGFQFVVFPAVDDPSGVFEEAVVVYPRVEAAKPVFEKFADALGSCDGKSVSETRRGSEELFEYAIEKESAEDASLRWAEEGKGPSGSFCVFEVRMIKNLLLGVVGCGGDAGDITAEVADAMAAKAV